MKPSYWYNQSAVLPFLHRDGELYVVLIKTRKGKRWTIPKGIVEPGLSPLASALKEALEEAGLKGRGQPEPIGCYAYRKWGGTCTVQVFPLEVTDILDEWEESWRQREIFRIADAVELIENTDLARIIWDFGRTVQGPANAMSSGV